jgi:hypothetical protein
MTIDAILEISRCQREALRAAYAKSRNANQRAAIPSGPVSAVSDGATTEPPKLTGSPDP